MLLIDHLQQNYLNTNSWKKGKTAHKGKAHYKIEIYFKQYVPIFFKINLSSSICYRTISKLIICYRIPKVGTTVPYEEPAKFELVTSNCTGQCQSVNIRNDLHFNPGKQM